MSVGDGQRRLGFAGRNERTNSTAYAPASLG
jgi:hypothetical protein